MSNAIARLFEEPPPSHAFEISEAGIAFAHGHQVDFRPFEPGTLQASPSKDNLLRPEAFAASVAALVPAGGKNKRRRAALILPDFAARVQVLDFDAFPSYAEEQLSLIRFRVRKTVPFDVDSAIVSYHPQPHDKRVDVVAGIIALEIVARYEAPFRQAGFQPGLVTTSSLAALNLAPSSGVSIIVKLSGRVLSVMVQNAGRLQLTRTVEVEHMEADEILAVLHPTVAYIEDEMATRPDRLYVVGQQGFTHELGRELGIPVETLSSPYGTPSEYNAGLLGYLKGGGVH